MSARTTSRHPVREGRPSTAWLPGTLLGILGIILLVIGLVTAARDRAGEAQTATALAQAHGNVWAVRSSAASALLDQPGSMATLNDALTALQATGQLLEKGGQLRSTDGVGVRPLSDIEGVSGQALRTDLDTFVAGARKFQDNALGLDAAAQVLTQESAFINTINELLAAWRRLPQAQVPAEATAAAEEVAKTPRSTLEAWFPSSGAVLPAQAEAVSVAQAHARTVRALADAAPPAQKAAASAFADAVNRWAESLRALAASQPYREAANAQWPTLSGQALTVNDTFKKVRDALDRAAGRWRLADYLAIGGGLLGLVGILWWVYVAWSASTQQWALSQDHRSAMDATGDIDGLVRQLTKIVNHHGEVVIGDKLRNDDPSSPTFGLRAIINRLLEARDAMSRTAEGRLEELKVTLDVVEVVLSAVPALGSVHWNAASKEANRRAERMALLGQRFADARARVTESLAAGAQAHDIVHRALRESDGLREDVQSGSKRVKRMGEGSQVVRLGADLLRGQLRRIHVLALNISIEAASLGPAGQAVAATAREMDGFIQNAVNAAANIDEGVVVLQDDAQEAVAALERSTGALVSNSQLNSRAVSSLRDLDRLLKILLQFINAGVEVTERQALDFVELENQYVHTATTTHAHEERARAANESVHRVKETLRLWANELAERSRRI